MADLSGRSGCFRIIWNTGNMGINATLPKHISTSVNRITGWVNEFQVFQFITNIIRNIIYFHHLNGFFINTATGNNLLRNRFVPMGIIQIIVISDNLKFIINKIQILIRMKFLQV